MQERHDDLARRGEAIDAAAPEAAAASGQASMPAGPAPDATRRRDAIYRAGLAISDMVSAAFALFIGVAAIGDDVLEPVTFAAAPLVAVVAKVIGLYDRDAHVLRPGTLDEAPAIFRVATLFTLLFWLADSFFVRGWVGHGQVIGVWGLLFLFMLAGRAVARRAGRLLAGAERCLVLGHPWTARAIGRRLEGSAAVNARVVAQLPFEGLDALPRLARAKGIERVVISPESSNPEEMLEAIRCARWAGLKVSVLPRLFEVVGSSVEFDTIDGVTVLGLREYGLGRSSSALKRAMDLGGSLAGLALLGLPTLMLVLTLKLRSRAPVLVRERRLGRRGEEFELLRLELPDSRAGRIARGFGLHRVPELVNVLRGDLSLVGPAPLPPGAVELGARATHSREVPPGMTGLAQVAAPGQVSDEDAVKFDYLYSTNWSVWLDVRVLIRTLSSVGRRQ